MIRFTQYNFDLKQIADSGQCFRMAPLDSASISEHFPNFDCDCGYSVISGSHYVEICQKNTSFAAICYPEHTWSFWENYFDLNTDYHAMIQSIQSQDKYLSKAAHFGSGIRILKQDPWEMIITFIISQQKTIPKIKEAVEQLSHRYGSPYTNNFGHSFYAFPSPHQLSEASLEDLQALKLGYRSKYIYRTCRDAVTGALDLSHLNTLNYQDSMAYLVQFFGIGQKVANCICLFGLHHVDAFPVDTWIQKILLREYYRPEYDRIPKNRLFETIIQDNFGMYKGFEGVIQQYIFFYERMEIQSKK